MNYKEWIQNKANEIALEKYDKGLYEPPSLLQETIYHIACGK